MSEPSKKQAQNKACPLKKSVRKQPPVSAKPAQRKAVPKKTAGKPKKACRGRGGLMGHTDCVGKRIEGAN